MIDSIEQGVPAPVITMAMAARFASQGKADYGNRMLAMMRNAFGGHAVKDAAECARRIRELYAADLQSEAGLLHVAVVWRSPGQGLINIAMNDAKPASPTDDFVLGLARARADAIVTTGANLRLEPRLTHAYHGDPRTAGALEAWRRDVLGKGDAPVSVVLTASARP